jgi:hypothetical protein
MLNGPDIANAEDFMKWVRDGVVEEVFGDEK